MTPEKCRKVVDFYRENLIRLVYEESAIAEILGVKRPEIVKPQQAEEEEMIFWELCPEDGVAHLLYMLDEMEKFLDEGRTEKVYGWLCFIQGVCWALGYQTLKELKDLNRPEPDTGEATVGDPSTAEISI